MERDELDPDDVSSPRRNQLADIEREIEPGPSAPGDDQAVYGESDLDPNLDDERDVHHADLDDIV